MAADMKEPKRPRVYSFRGFTPPLTPLLARGSGLVSTI